MTVSSIVNETLKVNSTFKNIQFNLSKWLNLNNLELCTDQYIFKNYANQVNGYTALQWEKHKRYVPLDLKPKFIVLLEAPKKTSLPTFKPIVAISSSPGKVWVAERYNMYFSYDQTLDLECKEKIVKEKEENVSSSLKEPPHHPSSITTGPYSTTTLHTRKLRQNRKKKVSKNTLHFCIPENIRKEDFPLHLWGHICFFCSNFRQQQYYQDTSTPNLSYDIMFELMGNGKDTQRKKIYPQVKDALLDKVFTHDRIFMHGHKCYTWSLMPEYDVKWIKIEVESSQTRKRREVLNHPVFKKMIENLHEVELTPDWRDRVHPDHYLAGELIENKQNDVFQPKDKYGHRFHSIISNCPEDLRSELRYDGRPLVEIDGANSQLWFLAQVLKSKQVKDTEEFIQLCEDGQIYEYFEKFGWTRKTIKKMMIADELYSKNGWITPFKSMFALSFPAVHNWLCDIKFNDVHKLCMLLQRNEAKFWIYAVGRRLQKEGIFYLTRHDSYLILPDHQRIVENIIKQEAMKMKMKITLRTK